jgi:AcrR family transcriptional regulator
MTNELIISKIGPNLRPLSRKKYLAIVEAARQVFLECGFTASSVDVIAETANVSKRTIYKHFEDKKSLFSAVVQILCREVVPGSIDALDTNTSDPRDTLVNLGVHFLTQIYTPEQIELYRIVVSEAKRFPELGEMMNKRVVRTERFAQHYLEDLQKSGIIEMPCPDIAASQFFGLLKTNVQLKLLFGTRKRITKREIRRISECCVDIFLNGILESTR